MHILARCDTTSLTSRHSIGAAQQTMRPERNFVMADDEYASLNYGSNHGARTTRPTHTKTANDDGSNSSGRTKGHTLANDGCINRHAVKIDISSERLG